MFEVPQHREEGVMSQKDFHRKFGLTDGITERGKKSQKRVCFLRRLDQVVEDQRGQAMKILT